jgi:hypothetical protein
MLRLRRHLGMLLRMGSIVVMRAHLRKQDLSDIALCFSRRRSYLTMGLWHDNLLGRLRLT